jgi:hypothetical protein
MEIYLHTLYYSITYIRSYMNNLSYNEVGQVNHILELDKYNGRVNIAEPEDPMVRFRMHERIANRNKASNYFDALTGNLEWNVLAQVYFSAENIQIIQNGLRAGVYRMSEGKLNVPPQNIDTLKIIMRSTYLQHAKHLPNDITGQVAELNSIVLDYAVPSVYNEAVGYMKYTQDQSTLVVPIERPQIVDRQYKQLEPRAWL